MFGGGKCGKCHEVGHNSRTCPSKNDKTEMKTEMKTETKTLKKPRKCGKCHEVGHNKSTCHKQHMINKVSKSVKPHLSETEHVPSKKNKKTIKKSSKEYHTIHDKTVICEKCGHNNNTCKNSNMITLNTKSLSVEGKSWVEAAQKDMIDREMAVKKKVTKKKVTKKSSKCEVGHEGDVVYNVKEKGVLLANNFDDTTDIDGWWASEKWDGYRAVWNGNSFSSRSGKTFDVPDWYRSVMPPNVALDGELWLGRGAFEKCGLLRRKKPVKPDLLLKWEDEWKKSGVTFNVFDILGQDMKFEDRMKVLQQIVKERNSCMKHVGLASVKHVLAFTKQTKVTKPQAIDMAKEVIAGGGEGIMLRQPGSLYEPKRSKTLYKIKEVDDMEVIIEGYKMGQGKYKGLLGSFTAALMTDRKIKCNVSGMDDKIRNSYLETHPIGTVITITYNGTTGSGKPRHPRYLRIRHKEGH